MLRVKSYFDAEESVWVDHAEFNQQVAAYDRIVKEAEKAGLISMAYGGVVLLLHPRVQVEEGCYHRIQVATGNEHRCTSEEG